MRRDRKGSLSFLGWVGVMAVGLLLSAATLLLWEESAPTPACAQQPKEQEPADEGGGGPSAEQRKKILERIQALRVWKLEEVLEVDAATLSRVDTELRKFDDRLLTKQLELEQTQRKLRRAVHKGAPGPRYEALIERTLTLREEVDRLRTEQYRAAARHLASDKKARLLLFIPEFDKKVRQVIRERRERKRRGGRRGGRGNDRPDDLDDDEPGPAPKRAR